MMRPFLALLLLATAGLAGGGPETTLVVVNAASPVSRRVANEYVALREIPQSHVVFIDGMPNLSVVSVDFFLERIWKPIAEHMKKAGLEAERRESDRSRDST